jgi:FeS assembly SUF system regulator
MLRITRQADYGIVLLTYIVREVGQETVTAAELARRTLLPAPTVTKILKLLTRAGLLISHRGVQGGYQLSRDASEIRLLEVIGALDGPIAITQCSTNAVGCNREPNCPVKPNWRRIDQVVRRALMDVTLEEMAEAPAPLSHDETGCGFDMAAASGEVR